MPKRRHSLTGRKEADQRRERVARYRAGETDEEVRERNVANAERMQLQRVAETAQHRSERNEQNAERMRLHRQEENSPQRVERNQDNAERMRLQRQEESSPQRNERNQDNAERMRLQREQESSPQRNERNQDNAERMRIQRQEESSPQRNERNQDNAERMRLQREQESSPQRNERNQESEQRMRILRAQETSDQRQVLNDDNTERMQLMRAQRTDQERQLANQQAAAAVALIRRDRLIAGILPNIALQTFDFEFDEGIIPRHDCGSMDKSCHFCHSVNFEGEKVEGSYSICCHKGKISLPDLMPPDEEIRHLLTEDTEAAKNFRQNIRSYNSAFALASMGARIVEPPGRGPYCFRIHGQIYHRTCHLHPPPDSRPSYAQLYILDAADALRERSNHPSNQQCLPEVMEVLQTKLTEVNPYVAAYKFMHEVEAEEIARATAAGSNVRPVRMFLYSAAGTDQRRYNAPRANEVAAVFVGTDGEPPAGRDLVIYPRGTANTIPLSILSPNCDPMTYILFFPRGDRGWCPGMPHSAERATAVRNTVTMAQFYAYRLAVRPQFSSIHYGGKLLQQYIVDAYVKTEGTRLQYIRDHQRELRVELYQGLMDHIFGDAADHSEQHGRVIILPSSFPGSPRAMTENYQDAMSIVAKYGKPDLFITFTCNPQWKAIQDNLFPGQRSEDRPDLVARVFHLKLKEFLCDVTDRHVLGRVLAYVYVIEFQKRGLPHCHLLIILSPDDKLRTTEAIDKVAIAELPHPERQPRLFSYVRRFMIHGPCGVHNPNSVCMVNNQCSKRFPKPFSEETRENVDGYPQYRRRNNGSVVEVRHVLLDNRSVVLYNAWLLLKFEAHINVEVCSSIQSVRYLYKYLYKGHDAATVEIREAIEDGNIAWDEISTFLDARYVSAPEAVWRLLECRMHGQSHTVLRLAVHLPMQQAVYFVAGEEQDALERATGRNTTLTAWFKLNAEDPTAREVLYPNIPQSYVFHRNAREWKKRERGGENVLGRMAFVSPRDNERFHVRLLLLHVSGATSFEALRTVDGTLCHTFKEAARRLNLVDDDTEWERSLSDAVVFQSPRQLRQLFALICIFCNPRDPLRLWHLFQLEMTEDFLHSDRRDLGDDNIELSDLHRQKGLVEIQQFLVQHGKNCSAYGLPHPNIIIEIDPNELLAKQRQDELIGRNRYEQLNPEQKSVVDEILNCVYGGADGTGERNCFFLDGPAGTGKTFVYNTLIHTIRGRGDKVIAVARSGIAANLLDGGTTAHSKFRLPVPILDNSTCNIAANSPAASQIREAKLIIWDEASMIPGHALIAVERCFRDVMNSNLCFGGKPILLGGCFRQVLPVVRNAARSSILSACLKRCHLWPLFQQRRLHTNVRADANALQFSNWLLKIGEGLMPIVAERGNDVIQLPDDMCIAEQNIHSLISDVYGDLGENNNPDFLSSRAILTPKNEDTHKINAAILDMIPGQTYTYFSVDTVVGEDEEETSMYPVEFLNSITPGGMPPHRLELKLGTVVILLRNINTSRGLCNGTRLIVRQLGRHAIDTEVATGSAKGSRLFLSRINLAPSDTNLPFQLCRKQFPIRLAFAMTINKAQGQTLEKAGIYLPVPVFTHGQLYVALSRVRNFHSMKVVISHWPNASDNEDCKCTSNIVYRELFQ